MLMSKRMQVLFDPPEYRQIVRVAKANGLTVSEWVRQTLRAAASAAPVIDRGRKLAAIRVAAACSFPTADIESMLGDIDRGRAMGMEGA